MESNFSKSSIQAGLRHVSIKVTLQEDSLDETTLHAEAEAAGIDATEQQQVRLKLTQIQQQHIDNAPSLADTLTEIPTSPEAIQATKIQMLKACAQNLAAVNQRMHQIISEHPWAEKTLTGSLRLFGDSMRAMLYIDMCALGAVGGSAICRSLNVNPRWTRHCALLGSAVSAFYTGLVLEPGLNDLMAEGVNQLSHIAAEHLGDTVAEKAAIKQLARDTVMAGGVILGGRYLGSRVASAGAQGAAQSFAARGAAAEGIESQFIKSGADRKITDQSAHPSLPVGNRTSKPTPEFHTPNQRSIINQRSYCSHALDEMRTQGIMPSVVENTIQTGQRFEGYLPTREIRYDPSNNISVVIEKNTGEVVTASFGKLKGVR